MGLKNKILLIVFAASVAASVVTGAALVFVFKLMGMLECAESPVPMVAATLVCLLSMLFMLVLLIILLSKNVIMPAVEREMLESERKMLNEQLHHSQKMEAVGRLAGSIAHDFNNLLTIIDGYSSLIVADPKGEDTPQHANEVIEAARKASFITRKLLSFSQKEKTEPVTLDLNSTLQDTDKMLARLIGEKITLVTKPHDTPIYVNADPVQMGQVLMNLAVNARDAMPNGGRITIKVSSRNVAHGECRKPDKLAEGTYAEISVHDTGHGIDEEIIDRIFEAFFTTKSSGKGTGLGLSIVKSIMKENDGFIDVRSKLGSGTTFYIYLPVIDLADDAYHGAKKPEKDIEQDASKSELAEGDSPEKIQADRPTILLVEDDPMILTLVAQTLETQDYNILQAEEGWEGIKVARNHKGKIDLLFTDVVMPGLGGQSWRWRRRSFIRISRCSLCRDIPVPSSTKKGFLQMLPFSKNPSRPTKLSVWSVSF
ncbi:response regulator [Verrucomicrobia bacterium S94]|nr:response regulator [Verrucomicrobia bacterium S94]